MKISKIHIILLAATASLLSSCLDDNDVDYNDWQQKNTAYVAEQEAKVVNGAKVYTRIAPVWAPDAFTLVKWHNKRELTASALRPMDNSLVRVQYAVDDIDGNRIDDSYSFRAAYGDSIYECRPMDNIVGFWNTLTQMRVGDDVTCIIPANAGYGNVQNGKIPPYSTLVYRIKLVSIPRYEVPSK